MVKGKGKNKDKSIASSSQKQDLTVSDLREDRDLWYKICVMVYDLRNMSKDKTCKHRTLQTTDPLYISEPYFTPEEATLVKSALADRDKKTSVENTITTNLENFFEKRRASGDSRPCGPHNIFPIYVACFGIDKGEIEDEKFVSRVRRAGLKIG